MLALEDILAATGRRVARAKYKADMRVLQEMADHHTPRGFRKRLLAMAHVGPAVIAELKKASPSKGVIRKEFVVPSLAVQLAKGGASALSVLTDEQFFQGSLDNLRAASSATDLPCLRKDFILDEFQLLEAKAYQADAILLILAALDDDNLAKLLARARELDLDVLCEVHDDNELKRALEGGAEIIGVNNRDLKTFQIKPDTALDMAPKIPNHVLRIAESGIDCGADIRELYASGFQGFLIGEVLMRAEDPGQKLQQLLQDAGPCPPYPSTSANWRGTVQ